MNTAKQIKRHIWAKEQRILISHIPPFQALVEAELQEAGFCDYERSDHGLYLSAKIEDIYRLHLRLATASRIWLIPAEFRAGATEELFRKCLKLPWELYLAPKVPIKISARVRESRIQHEGGAADTLGEAIIKRLDEQGGTVPPLVTAVEAGQTVQNIQLTAEANRIELRIDLTGEHLHRRGYRKLVSEAPLRETLAAGLVRWSLEGYREQHPQERLPVRILDPFCGSGTIPIETSIHADGMFPGRDRSFLFERQPHYREAAYRFIRRNLKNEARFPVSLEIIGCDKNPDSVELAEQNSRTAGSGARFRHLDAFSPETAALLGPRTLVITNPPYGERLEGGVALYRRLIQTLQESATPAVVLVPRSIEKTLALDSVHPQLHFDNGGIRVALHWINPQRTR